MKTFLQRYKVLMILLFFCLSFLLNSIFSINVWAQQNKNDRRTEAEQILKQIDNWCCKNNKTKECKLPSKSPDFETIINSQLYSSNTMEDLVTCDNSFSVTGKENNYTNYKQQTNQKEWELFHMVCSNVEDCPKNNILKPPSTLGDLNKMGNVDIPVLIGKGIKLLMQVIGTIALLMFVYGGVLWMISAGSAEKTKKAMDIMLWASLGVIVILASYALVDFVFKLF